MLGSLEKARLSLRVNSPCSLQDNLAINWLRQVAKSAFKASAESMRDWDEVHFHQPLNIANSQDPSVRKVRELIKKIIKNKADFNRAERKFLRDSAIKALESFGALYSDSPVPESLRSPLFISSPRGKFCPVRDPV